MNYDDRATPAMSLFCVCAVTTAELQVSQREKQF